MRIAPAFHEHLSVACRLLLDGVMRWALVLILTVASATAWGQPAQTAVATTPGVVAGGSTEKAQADVQAAERRVAQLAAQRASLAKRYQDELDTIDRLKKQKASWRRDREVSSNMSDAKETADQLTQTTRELQVAQAALATARKQLVVAIDTELKASPSAARTRDLQRLRAQIAPASDPAPRRIMIPDTEIDPLADPEELEQRAAELRASEDELNRQVVGLDAQAKELDQIALVKKQHERSADMFNRDDDQPHRNAHTTSAGGQTLDTGGAGAAAPSSSDHGAGGAIVGSSRFESDAAVVLSEVVDAKTLDSLAAAQRSGDPAQRAEAAHKAHDAVARRLADLRKKRGEIEARAKQLRGKH